MMLSHLFESTITPIITKIIKFCYLIFLAMGRFCDILACKRRLAISLSSSFSRKSDRPFGISHKVRSPFTPFSQPRAIALPESTFPDSNLRFVKFSED